MRTALLLAFSGLGCGKLEATSDERDASEIEAATDTSAPSFEVASPPEVGAPPDCPSFGGKEAPFYVAGPECAKCSCTLPGSLSLTVGDREVRLTEPVADCSGATGPLFRIYSYGDHFEFTVSACAEPGAKGECIYAMWARGPEFGPIVRVPLEYRDPSGELWALTEIDGCVASGGGDSMPLGGRFQAVARAKDGRTTNVRATFDACNVFGSTILGKFREPYALPDCP